MRTGFIICLPLLIWGMGDWTHSANPVLIEAEAFHDPGGWTSDTQFIDQMGSPYLLAIGLGTPVDDAVTTVAVPEPAAYRVWARSRDWVPDHHPGRFQIILDGQPTDRTLGQSGQPGWIWEDAGVSQLSETVEIRLHDLTGYYARCDAIVLSADLNWSPPSDKQALASLRAQLGGTSRTIDDAGEYDVVVVGGGLAGCMAAVSAARLGASSVLIQNRPVLGGNASVEILVPPVGVWPYGAQDPLDPKETGLVEEIRGQGVQTTEEAKPYSGRLLRLVRAEPNLDLHFNTHATGVEMKDGKTISSVVALDVQTGRQMRFSGRVFVDCTGDASIGLAAGAEYRHGREPRSMYDESMAPEVGDRKTMGNSLKFVSQPTGSPQAFQSLPWVMEFPRCDDFTPGRHPRLSRKMGWQWMIELGGTRDTYHDAEEIRDDLLRLVYGMWDHVKNHCDEHSEKAADHNLVWVGHVAGKRENRRLIGDYVLNQNDISNQTLFPDRVAYGGWGIDDHYPEGFFYDGPAAQHGYKGVLHSIPYRSLYSKNIENLLMAGRNISASHVGMAATRVMLTCAVLGQASGTAAAMCVQNNTTARGIHSDHIDQLQQQLLKDGAHIVQIPNRDPLDLARTAAVTASSELVGDDGSVMEAKNAKNAINGYARAVIGTETNAWIPDITKSEPWIELAWDRPQSFNVVHVTFLTKNHAAGRFVVQAWQNGDWKTVAEVADNRFRRHVLGFDRMAATKLRVVLLETKAEMAGICEIRVYDEPKRIIEISRRSAQNRNLPHAGPGLPWDESVIWGPGVNPNTLPGLVIDTSQAEVNGSWVSSEYTGPFILDGYLHDGNVDKGAKSIRFMPRLPEPGEYELRIAYSAFGNRATNTPVTVVSSEGSETLHVDQRIEPPIDGLFLSLGKYRFGPEATTTVEITTAGTDGYVVVDAIQLIPIEAD